MGARAYEYGWLSGYRAGHHTLFREGLQYRIFIVKSRFLLAARSCDPLRRDKRKDVRSILYSWQELFLHFLQRVLEVLQIVEMSTNDPEHSHDVPALRRGKEQSVLRKR